MKIQQIVRKYVFIMSCVMLTSFTHKNISYAESQTNIQLYVPDDMQNNKQNSITDDNKSTDASKVKTGDGNGDRILDYQILLATSAILGIVGIKMNKKEKSGE